MLLFLLLISMLFNLRKLNKVLLKLFIVIQEIICNFHKKLCFQRKYRSTGNISLFDREDTEVKQAIYR